MNSEFFEFVLGIVHQMGDNKPEVLEKHKEQPQSEILEDILKYIQEHTDADKEDIVAETRYEHIHGSREIHVSVSLKGWNAYRYNREVVCYWREVKNNGTVFIYPFGYQEFYMPKKAFSTIISIIGTYDFAEFRKKRYTKAVEEARNLSKLLRETKEENAALREEIYLLNEKNEKLQDLLSEAYAPGGAIAAEAQKHFEGLSS